MASLNFKGKSAVWNHHLSVPYHTLENNPKLSLKGDNADDNLIIEGDNLLALKSLLPQYQGKVKCIFIDPPYNTGNEKWVYNDNVNSPLIHNWIGGVVGKDDLTRHDKWLCMLTPRLKLLRDLLSDNGVIFACIDENEVHHLKQLLDEVFGENNFAGEIIWKNSSKNDQSYVSIQHEYILCYVKDKTINKGQWTEKKEGLEEIYKAFESFKKKHGSDWAKIHEEAVKWFGQFPESNQISASKHYSWMDERGVYFPADISGPNFGQYVYNLKHPVTGKDCKAPASGWRYPKETMLERVKQNLIHFGQDESKIPNNKTYLKDTEYQSLTSVKYRDGRVASQQLTKLLGASVFTNPKDVDLIKTLFKAVGVQGGDIVLDSFAGSGSTAQAVLELNHEDKEERHFVLIQMDEKIDKEQPAYQAGYKSVQAITQDRVLKVIQRSNLKTGFRYYSLGSAIDAETILSGTLPTYNEFAKYVYYLATGKNHPAESKIKESDYFVGKSDHESFYLVYEKDIEKLKKLAIILDWAQKTHKKDPGKKVVYAPACFLDDESLDQYNIKFVSIPYNLFERTA